MNSRRHEARYDAWKAAYIRSAKTFVCCVFLGSGKYDKREAPTLGAARLLRRHMQREYGDRNFGRRILIYAVTREGMTILVD